MAEHLLDQLAVEEGLLRDAREGVMGVYAALRRGDLLAVNAALPGNGATAARLTEAGERRQALVCWFAEVLGLPMQGCSLAEIAERVPEPLSARLRATRGVLRELTAQVDQFRMANANLIDRLRSYFRDVVSATTAVDAPVRYGPSGAVVSPAFSIATFASG